MQDEIRKHSKKAVGVFRDSDHSFFSKIKEIIIEILIIAFAVSFSIWLHAWSEHRHNQKEVKEFMIDLKSDLNKDIESLEEGKKIYSNTMEAFTYLTNLAEYQFDSLSAGKDSAIFKTNINNKLSSFPNLLTRSNCGNYEGFKSSGKIGFIENKKLKKIILDYYEQQSPIKASQDLFTQQMTTKTYDIIAEMSGKKTREIIFNKKLQTYLQAMIVMANASKENYDETIKSARNIIVEIDKTISK